MLAHIPLLATLRRGCAPLLFAIGALPVLTMAADAPSAPRRAADPALVRALQSNVWTLQSGTEASGQPIAGLAVPGHGFVLRFEGARVAVKGACNQMNGSWRASPQDQLNIGRLASTMRACEEPLMKADTALAAALAQPLDVQWQRGSSTLALKTPGGQTLTLTGEPTLESRYGKPTRIFLEVDAQTVPCQSGAAAPSQCLRVRERRFDAQGLRIEPPGEWSTFHGAIEGYTHEPGIRNVLRVNRYTRDKVPADASRYVYVLDLVVESAIVSK